MTAITWTNPIWSLLNLSWAITTIVRRRCCRSFWSIQTLSSWLLRRFIIFVLVFVTTKKERYLWLLVSWNVDWIMTTKVKAAVFRNTRLDRITFSSVPWILRLIYRHYSVLFSNSNHSQTRTWSRLKLSVEVNWAILAYQNRRKGRDSESLAKRPGQYPVNTGLSQINLFILSTIGGTAASRFYKRFLDWKLYCRD